MRTELTPREEEVLLWVARGLRNREIARKLEISTKTVEFHVSNSCSKLHARSRTELVTVALRKGLLAIDQTHPSPISAVPGRSA